MNVGRAITEAMLPPIESAFAKCDGTCPVCHGAKWVCEDHPGRVWEGFADDALAPVTVCDCGGAGMPCPGLVGLHA